VGERRFKIEVLLVAVHGLADRLVEEVGDQRGDDHQRAHVNSQMMRVAQGRGGLDQRQGQEGDQGHAGDAVGLETVGGRPDAVAGIVTRAVGDDAGILGIVLGQLEDDLHEVGADVGDLGEDAAADAEDGGAEGFADGEADEAGADERTRQEHQDANHEEQFHAHEQQADAHAGAQGMPGWQTGLPLSAEKAVRELETVLMRMPNQATP
jgi:hypothetical protein